MDKGYLILAAGLILMFAAFCSEAQLVQFTFKETTEGWTSIPPPTGTDVTISLTDDPASVKGGQHALMAHYVIEASRLSGLAHPVNGLVGTGARVWFKTDKATMLVLGLLERDGSTYAHVIQIPGGEWTKVEAPFTAFRLGDDSSDENGKLDLDQVAVLLVVDAGGLLPEAGGEQTLWMDEYDVTSDIKAPEPEPYHPLLQTGIPSASGARATAGITYHPAKFGSGVLTDAPGELVVVPIEGRKDRWHWEEGTIEMWLCPQFDIADVLDFTGLVAMQNEPFNTGFNGSLLIFYVNTHQIAFLINGRLEKILATPLLTWKSGDWHHLAASWGKSGMRLYMDGKLVAQNQFDGGPGIPAADVIVGNQAWTIMSHRFSNTVIDEMRMSGRQRTDEEIAASANATEPLNSDSDTLALEHFDGQPLPPITLKLDDAPFHAASAEKPVNLTALVPGKPDTDARFAYTVSTPGGATVVSDTIKLDQQVKIKEDAFSLILTLKPFQIPGFYHIAFRLEKGGEVISEGTDWFCILSKTEDEGRKGEAPDSTALFSISGCYADPQTHEEFFKRASVVGVRSLRMPFEWTEIEPNDNEFVWDKYDRIVEWADKYGVKLIPTFIWENPQPAWAGRGKVNDEHYPPDDLEKWSDFVSQVVSRYKGRIHWWIPANEPNLSKYWHPKPDAKAYVALLKATREAAQRADPQAKILGCSVAGMDLRFLEECFKEGALSYSDAIGIHPYICPHSPDERIPIDIINPNSMMGTFREGLLATKALIEKYGGKQKLWLDEAGQPYRNDFILPNWGVSEEKAAEYLVKIYTESLASGAVERVLWFSFWGGEYGSFALLKPDWNPTLPLVAYTALASRLSGATFLREGLREEGARSLVFQKGEQEMEVAWCPKGEREVQLQKSEQAFDLYGFPLIEANTTRRLMLSALPVYLEQ